ncbi:MAG: sarcosine oxidase subunit gamma [Octadecabacter sp.]
MHDLEAITSLGATAPQIDTHAGVTCTEVNDLALASVAARLGSEAVCAEHMNALLGAQAPGPGKSRRGASETAVWMGPDQWMISAPFKTHDDIAELLKSRFTSSASIVEQTDAWCCFDLTGQGVTAVMELLCNIDMRKLQSGDAHRTTIHHLGCIVVCNDPDGLIRILGPRASAASLHHAITTAMRSAL